jgi:Skp family chaperone for outer membrane proteins
MRFMVAVTGVWLLLAIGIVGAQVSGSAQTSFPAGSKFGYIDIQRVAAESSDGQASSAKVQDLSERKLSELEQKNTELQQLVGVQTENMQEAQLKFQQGQNVMSADARLDLQREISKLQVDIQRLTQDSQAEIERLSQDADAEVQELQQQLQIEFQQQLGPAIEQLANELELQFIFSAGEGGLLWADVAMDLTQDVIDLLNEPTLGSPE